MNTRMPVLAVGILFAALVAVPAHAGEQRPFTGRFTAQAVSAEPRCDDALTLGFEIRGQAAHLGSFMGTGSNCTEWALATSAVAIWNGVAIFTAADGSTITTASEGSQAAPVAGQATFSVDHTITSGTGRLAAAGGVFTVTGVIDFTTGMITGHASGWMTY